jgi:hypothetical protein
MSKFIDAVTAELGYRKKHILPPLTVTKEFREDSPMLVDSLSEYKIEVRWKVTGYCKPNELHIVQENVIRELREVVYGDFKDRIIRLERAVYERDDKVAQMEIRDILREVFGY